MSAGVASSIIGGSYPYIHVFHNSFLLKSIVSMVCEQEYIDMSPLSFTQSRDDTKYLKLLVELKPSVLPYFAVPGP